MSQPPRDSGFTLIEVLVTITLLGVLMAIAVSGWSSWARASEQFGTARELQSVLRETQQRAVTEGTAMCVTFADTAYTVWRGSCTTAAPPRTRVLGPQAVASGVRLTSVDVPLGVGFTARGTSADGSVTVTRSGSSKVYTLEVDGFTGRVSLD
jgi:prepilin-type N-terminal cleavage/methylation domain-containing protein